MPRKIFHALAASILPTAYYFSIIPRPEIARLTVACAVIWITFEIVRFRVHAVNYLFQKYSAGFMKKKETTQPTGVMYLLISSALALYLFPPETAVASLFFLSLGDPAASIIGKKYGNIRLRSGKSLEGTLAMFFVCLVIGEIFVGLRFEMAMGAAAAALTELFAGRLDDNLTVPLMSGGMMTLAAGMF